MTKDYEMFKQRFLQEPISMLTAENLHDLELHCEKQIRREVGQRVTEHEIVLELIHEYKKQQEEIEKNRNFINYLQLQDVKKLEQIIKKDKIIDKMAIKIHTLDDRCTNYCNNKSNGDCEISHCKDCIIEYFEEKVDEK